jgi:hypothetical protein
LLARVEELLGLHEGAASFLESPALPPSTLTATAAWSPDTPEGLGTVIGPYRLLEQIGEGGMGVVFMAEQTHPVRRRVALKVIKPGMDTRQVIARFEAERQALAMMDHPNIAKVHDAGTTDSGRPYFVMELVRGIPITEHCDREQLSIPVAVHDPIKHVPSVFHLCAYHRPFRAKGLFGERTTRFLSRPSEGLAHITPFDLGWRSRRLRDFPVSRPCVIPAMATSTLTRV